MSEHVRHKGWWQTVPGVITATAGIITALTGLILALHQVGLLDADMPGMHEARSDSVQRPTAEGVDGPAGGANESPQAVRAAAIPIVLPAEARIRHEDLVYEVLSARLEGYAPGKKSLTFDIRLTNNGNYPVNFWAASFRLLVDDILRAPVGELNELVDAHSSREGSVEFVIPDEITHAGLQMGEVGEDAPAVPIALGASR